MQFIRKVSSTETDIQFAICNSVVFIRKSALSFISTNLEVKPINLPILAKSKPFSYITGSTEYIQIKSTKGIGYFHISSYALPPDTTPGAPLKAARFTVLDSQQLSKLKLKKHCIVGFSGNF
jgi:hypothetical protein